MTLNYPIRPRRVAILLGGIALGLSIVSFIADYLLFFVLELAEDDLLADFLDMLSVSVEASIPTWYAVMLLATAAFLLTLICVAKRRQNDPFRVYWIGLALVFTYLSMDESAVIHETFSTPLENTFNTSGLLTFGWPILFAPLVVIFVLLYLRFLWHLPRGYQRLFVLSGAVYVGGAIVVEALSASQYTGESEAIRLSYVVLFTIEECCEMLGVVVFIYTLLSYMRDMGYAFALNSDAHAIADQPVPIAAPLPPSDAVWRVYPLIAVIVLLLLTNGGLLFHMLSGATEQAADERSLVTRFREDYADSEMLVVELDGIFGLGNAPAQQMTAALLSNYAQVIVIALPEDDQSIAFAGEGLPFNQDQLSERLRGEGMVDYIIFDTPMVLTIASAAFPIISQ